MARNTDTLSPRQRQSQRIMREKAAKKKRRVILHRCAVAGGALLVLAVVGGTAWAIKSGAAARAAGQTVDAAYGLTARAGFALKDIYLEGRGRTPMAAVEQALDIRQGDPILRLSLAETRERLEAIDSVKMAAVERALPDTLYVRIVEREPVALWQHEGKLALVDDNGAVMSDVDAKAYGRLPLIVGEGAPGHVGDLLAILASDAALAKQFVAGVFVGERRWNIRLKSGVEVKLPEADPVGAWKKLAALEADRQLLERDVRVIDLRLDGRLFMTLPPAAPHAGTAGAKET